jgi:UTP--glucose-1-phosphate uridylyltransferase
LKVAKAVITAAAPNQRSLPVQTLVDREGRPASVLAILIGEAVRAGIEEICVVVYPGDEAACREAAGEQPARLHFVPQTEPRGYGRAVHCARAFTAGEPFLHMVGDHIYVSTVARGCAEQVAEAARAQSCSVSGVQPTREHMLPYFGAVGGQRVAGTQNLYVVDRVLEKPTPTEAEQALLVPGLRAGHYLCFFGVHVFTPLVMDLLDETIERAAPSDRVQLSPVLEEVARQERYLALQVEGRRYPLDVGYGLLNAQVALALSGPDRETVLASLCELLAQDRRCEGRMTKDE